MSTTLMLGRRTGKLIVRKRWLHIALLIGLLGTFFVGLRIHGIVLNDLVSGQFQLPQKNKFFDKSRTYLPSGDNYITVVIMNHQKPKTLLGNNLLSVLTDNSYVDEVLLCHSNPETSFKYIHPKVVNINAIEENAAMGLSLRFHFCHMRARNPLVLFVDDDLSVPSTAVNHVLWEMEQNSKRIVGAHGRGLRYDGSYPVTTFGPAEVVLTKFMLVEREVCSAFFQYQHVIFEDVVKPYSFPLWNGEDIFFSQVANHIYRQATQKQINLSTDKNNLAIDFGIREAPVLDKEATGVSGTSGEKNAAKTKKHFLYRSMLWNTAKNRLATFVGNDTKSLDYKHVPVWNEQAGLPGSKVVSVIIMNHGRPRSLQQSLLPTLIEDNHVDDIILYHVNPKTRFMHEHPKVSNRIVEKESWEEIGLGLRYQYCQEAKHRWVMFVDEDQIVLPNTTAKLLEEFELNPKRLVGAYGRQLGANQQYDETDIYGAVEVVLGKLVIMERELCDVFFNYQHFLLGDVVTVPDSDPFWDGADIFMSLLANHFYKVTNLAPKDVYSNLAMSLGLNESNLQEGGSNAISSGSGKPSQRSVYQSRLWTIGKSRLAALEEDYTKQQATKLDTKNLPNVTVVVQYDQGIKTLLRSSLLPVLTGHPRVDEIMILHSNPAILFNYSHPRVLNIDAEQSNGKFGLAKHFLFCQQARNPWVLMIDGDQELEPSVITKILEGFAGNTHRIVGSHGQGLDNENSLSPLTLNGQFVEVVSTKFMVMERDMCNTFFRYHHLVLHDVVEKHSAPLWNGEDIFMSHAASHVYHLRRQTPKDRTKVHYACKVPIRDARLLNESIGINQTRTHLDMQYRTMMWHTAKARLAALVQGPYFIADP